VRGNSFNTALAKGKPVTHSHGNLERTWATRLSPVGSGDLQLVDVRIDGDDVISQVSYAGGP